MTFREFTGKNVEEAIRTAMKEFSSELSELDIEILSQGNRGILGVGGEEARILAAPKSAVAAAETVRDTAPEPSEAPRPRAASGGRRAASAAPPSAPAEPAEAAEPAGESPADEQPVSEQLADLGRSERGFGREAGGRGPGGRGRSERGPRSGGRSDRPMRDRSDRPPRPPREDRPPREPAPFIPGKPLDELSEKERGTLQEAKGVLEELLRLMEVPGTVEIATGGETARLNVRGSDLGVLIGRRGEKLASLQHIVNLIVAKKEGEYHRIAVDVENYRGRREEQLRDVADRAAKRVLQTGKIIQLEPMPAIERRIVHMALVENPKVRTQSVGVEPNRRIVILPATKVE
jgi:spoIIIJ-associated protein